MLTEFLASRGIDPDSRASPPPHTPLTSHEQSSRVENLGFGDVGVSIDGIYLPPDASQAAPLHGLHNLSVVNKLTTGQDMEVGVGQLTQSIAGVLGTRGPDRQQGIRYASAV